MTIRRTALGLLILLGSIFMANPGSHGATTAASPDGLPLYQFVNSGVGPLPWNAVSLESAINQSTMAGGPHSAANATTGVVAYRTTTGDLDLYTQPLSAPSSGTAATTSTTPTWADLSTGNAVPVPAADPIPFFDPSANVELLYVDESGHLLVLSPNAPYSPAWAHQHRGEPWRPYVVTDLTALTGVAASNGLASIAVTGASALVAFRSATNAIWALSLSWSGSDPVPIYSGVVAQVAAATLGTMVVPTTSTTTTTVKTTTTTVATSTSTSTTTSSVPPTTTTTQPAVVTISVASDPVVLGGAQPSLLFLTSVGDLEEYLCASNSLSGWAGTDLTTLTQSPKLAGTVSVAQSATTTKVAALTSPGGAVELFQSATASSTLLGHYSTIPSAWSATNVTALTPNAPALDGSLALNVVGNQTTIAGQAANWGDLFVLTNTVGNSWSDTDVSVTAGSSARTVANVVAGLDVGTSLTLYAAGVNSPPKQGVGVYAIPSADWAQAIKAGWPIISETGGLGTQSAPWVGFTDAKTVATSPDFLLGQAIYNSHQRVTWLSFWTASGPIKPEVQIATTYYNHGYTAGAWVATQIDQYRGLGVGLTPDWVIFDPEGYPDNHSLLDAPGGSSNATLALYATYWKAMLSGWQQGIASVDPKLNAGVYASQSEYRNYGLASQSLPVFMAVAFGGGGPVPVTGATGSNIRGYIAFSATCTPTATLKQEEQTLVNPPWSGQFNTLQFNAGVYCNP